MVGGFLSAVSGSGGWVGGECSGLRYGSMCGVGVSSIW